MSVIRYLSQTTDVFYTLIKHHDVQQQLSHQSVSHEHDILHFLQIEEW